LLQKEGNDFYVVTPTSKKHIPVDRRVAAGYKPGDVLDIVIDYYGKDAEVVILGKSQKEFRLAEPHKKASPKTTSQAPQTKFDRENLLLGRVVKLSHDELVFIPNNKNFPLRQIPILNGKEEHSSFQNRICAMHLENIDSPLLGGVITEVYGIAGNPMHEIEAVAKYYNAIINWDAPGLREEIENLPTEVDVSTLDLITEEEANISQKGKTVDLRNLPIETIDPETCQDMDDGVFATFDKDGNVVLYSAIANITKYIPYGSLMFEEYINHAFTLYTPNMAYGITPEKLATGICCLTENQDRLAIVVKTVIDKNTGEVKSFNIYDAIVRSRKKYAYSETQQIFDENKDSISIDDLRLKIAQGEALSPVEQVVMNHYASELIRVGFDKRKMIRFDSNKERTITLNDDMSSVEDIASKTDLPYEKVIEHFMLTTNEATAKYAIDNGLDTIFRIHEEPNPRKVNKAGEFFGLLGIDMVDELSAESTNSLLDLVRGTASEEIVNNFLIRMQSRAIYSDKLYSDKKAQQETTPYMAPPVSHYALQSPHYSHFTAGI
ncbi:MAG: RNB domain-containing ribonuclease, partial [Clostridia bacterium]|nr:RNB domain-containing ribonuclease [Clostridia bacterium]